ncbi:MAG: radical SAM protein [Pseudomonadota bacterium]
MKKPSSAIVAVTCRCNGRCVMCNIWRNARKKELKAEDFARLPESLSIINITGGEPFLREDLVEIISVLNDRCGGPRFVISTNGLRPDLIEAQLKKMRWSGLRLGVRVSVDGVGQTHDAVRGVEGAFDRAMETVDVLKRLKVRDAGIAFTILKENAHQLKAVYDLSRRLGVQFTVSAAQNSEIYFGVNALPPASGGKIIQDQMEAVIRDQLARFNIKDWFRAYYLFGLHRHMVGKSLAGWCGAAQDFFFMDPEGNIYICPLHDMKLGNICESAFGDIWSSLSADKARAFAQTCSRKCWMTCTVTPYIRRRFLRVLCWIAANKIAVHCGKNVMRQ